ncbi:hypothetical protein BHM04_08550 [Macrococcus sp. IME1552]|nr:hypothetical protein BHM04_08550 [Macrococcus sp. IME1552]
MWSFIGHEMRKTSLILKCWPINRKYRPRNLKNGPNLKMMADKSKISAKKSEKRAKSKMMADKSKISAKKSEKRA